jgi:3-oxoacyl-[acyl-carrier protein] reductase
LPLGRLVQPEDFADAAVFLGSPAAKSITGHTLMLDCGSSAGRM